MMIIRLGTRQSQLALTQTQLVITALEKANPDITIQQIGIKTLGDQKQGTPRASQSDKKDWVHELEQALLDETIDFAVHSGKDIPVDIEAGTALLPVLARGNPFDAFIGRQNPETGQRISFSALPTDAKVGTASLRRQALLLRLRPDLNVIEHRGNIQTRLQKLDDSEDLMGIVLAAAGLERLSIEGLDFTSFSATELLPALNQGTLVVQYRSNDNALKERLSKVTNTEAYDTFQAERAAAEVLNGDCKSAISIFANTHDNKISLTAQVMTPNGKTLIESSDTQPRSQAKQLGVKIGHELLKKGAAQILEASRTWAPYNAK